MLLLAAFGVKRHQIDVNVGLRNPLYANVEMARYLIGGFNIALDARTGDRQLLPAQTVGGDIRQQLRRFYRTADFNDSFCHAAQPRQRIIQPRRIDGGVKIQLLNAKLAFYIGAVWAQRKVQPRSSTACSCCPLASR